MASLEEQKVQAMEQSKQRIDKAIRFLLVLLVLITLGSFASRLIYQAKRPSQTVSGTTWNREWELFGKKIGIASDELPAEWTLDYNQIISTSDKVYMGLYGYGVAKQVPYTDNDGKASERNQYPAGIYVITRGSGNEQNALADIAEWQTAQNSGCEDWTRLSDFTAGAEGETATYQCFSYTYGDGQSEDYSQGIALYGVVDGWAVTWQLDWSEELAWTSDIARSEMNRFLSACHVAK